MPPAPDVTIVVSTHNRASRLNRLLTTLLIDQDAGEVRYDVILVDNNSTDDTVEIVKPWRRSFRSLQYIFEPRQGVSFGRNAGVAAARGAIVAFTDDDNEPAKDWVSTIGRLFRENPRLELCGGKVIPRWSEAPPGWLDRRHWSPVAILDYGAEPFWTSTNRPVCLLTANLAVRRNVFDRIGGFSPRFPRCQDHEWLLRFWEAGGRGLYSPDLIVVGPVPHERMTRRYHRAWHRQHGRAAARMRLQERVGANGPLVDTGAEATSIAGAAPFVYRELVQTVAGWLRACGRCDRAGAFESANHVRYLLGYLSERAGADASVSRWISDVTRWLARRLRAKRVGGLTVGRSGLVYALIAVVFGASAYDIATGTEHWPFSPYPMFSIVDERPIVDSIRLLGVTAEASPREVPLLDSRVLEPFDQCRLSTALARVYSDPVRRASLPALLRDILIRYERRRIDGEHDGPRLQAIRAYFMHWEITADAANRDVPTTRRLLAEVKTADVLEASR
jgi:glucosyl-dolichyl phosphate glucuronosyltransferase